MLNLTENILPLTDFKRNSSAILSRMKKNQQPMVLTINGKAALVVHTAEDYQNLLGEIEKNEAIEGIRRGLKSMKKRRGRDAEQVFMEMETSYPWLRAR